MPKILIVDDVPDNIEVLGDAIAGLGDVSFALTGKDGLALARTLVPDLILLDVMMPEMDGYEVYAALQADDATSSIPVIFVTAKSDAATETAALDAGAMDFIAKPINPTVAKARVRMHLTLVQRASEVQQLNAELEQRVLERTQALNDALVRSQAAQDLKANLLANMNHEFRTPLNAVLGMSRMAARRVADPQVVEWMDKISNSGQQLLGLLSGILDLARIESHKLQIEHVPFHLQTVLSASVELLRPRAVAKGLQLDVQLDSALPTELVGDPVRIGNVLTNLISNAIKFTHQGAVSLRLAAAAPNADGLQLRIEVQDTGIGISAEEQQRIFEGFEQLDSSLTREGGGLGIGLSICKQLVAMMGGTLGLHSVPGQGSTFWAQLPLQYAPGSGADASAAMQGQQVEPHLRALLANDDFNAVALWETWRGALTAYLGPLAADFSQAMDAFDLGAAYRLLQAHPQA